MTPMVSLLRFARNWKRQCNSESTHIYSHHITSDSCSHRRKRFPGFSDMIINSMYRTPCVSVETVYNTSYGNEQSLQLYLLLYYRIDPLILAILLRDKPSVISIMPRGVLLNLSDCEFQCHFMPTWCQTDSD